MLLIAECRKYGIENRSDCPHRKELRSKLKSAGLSTQKYILRWSCPYWRDNTPLARINIGNALSFRLKGVDKDIDGVIPIFKGIAVSRWDNGYVVAVTEEIANKINLKNPYYQRIVKNEDVDVSDYYIIYHHFPDNVVFFPVRLKYVVEDFGKADVNAYFAQNHGE